MLVLKRFLNLLFAIGMFLLVFTFIPSGLDKNAVINAYSTTVSFSQGKEQMMSYIKFQQAAAEDAGQAQSSNPNGLSGEMMSIINTLVSRKIPYSLQVFPQSWDVSPTEVRTFCCASFVSYVLYQSGQIEKSECTSSATSFFNNSCVEIKKEDLQAGDILMFARTYNSGTRFSHIGIYIGEGKMAHSGNPAQIADFTLPYWQEHIEAYARLKGKVSA